MSQNHYPEDVTKLDVILSLLQRTGSVETKTAVQPISVRIPLFDYANVEAMAQYAGISRNKMFCQLIELGLAEVWAGLDGENAHHLNDLRCKLYMDLAGEHIAGKAELPQAEQGEC